MHTALVSVRYGAFFRFMTKPLDLFFDVEFLTLEIDDL